MSRNVFLLMPTRLRCLFSLLLVVLSMAGPSMVQAQSSVAPMMRLLKSGRLPESRLATVIKLIADRGDASDLAYLFEQATTDGGFSEAIRPVVLEALAEASRSRKLIPETDLSPLAALIKNGDPRSQLLAIELAGAWDVEKAADSLSDVVLDEQTSIDVAEAAMNSLVMIGGSAADATIAKLRAPSEPPQRRMLGIGALAKTDLGEGADAAAEFVSQGRVSGNPASMLQAFLDEQGGTSELAASLRQVELSPDNAKQLLRYLYSVGRSDAELIDVLNTAAGISSAPRTLSGEEMQTFIAKVRNEGDPHRGEQVFRRAEFSCLKCHAVSGAGGNIGPDLSPIGGSSPIDYLLVSILDPDQAIKEAYQTKTVLTVEGKVYQGIVADANEQFLVLRDATGKNVTIPTDDIDDEIEGKSLMPKGLYSLMTEQELVDVVRFLSELGKPGDFGIRSEPTIQRWRVLKTIPPELVDESPTGEAIEQYVLDAPTSAWNPAYGLVNGELPIAEIAADQDVIYLLGDVQVTGAGNVRLQVNDEAGVRAWVDSEAVESLPADVSLSEGSHRVVLRVDVSDREGKPLRVLVNRGETNSAEYTVVGGT